MKKSQTLFYIMLINSTMLTMCSNNWISMWMGMEINLMMFIPLIKNKKYNETPMIYFLTQSMGSALLMFSALSIIHQELTDPMTIILMMSLFIKMGAAPFHSWMIMIISKMNWTNCLILMTWQKLAPLMLINNINLNQMMLQSIILLSISIGAVGGLNQTSLRKLMGYSSINHLGWTLSLCNKQWLWMIYMAIYSVIIYMTCNLFNQLSTLHLSQIAVTSISHSEMIIISINMMSLGGLPPLIGFMPKWLVIQNLMSTNMTVTALIMIMFSILTLLYYLRIITPLLLTSKSENKWISPYNINLLMKKMLIVNLALPLMLIINMF